MKKSSNFIDVLQKFIYNLLIYFNKFLIKCKEFIALLLKITNQPATTLKGAAGRNGSH